LTDNVSQAMLDVTYNRFAAASEKIWNLTEGQVYIGHVDITDAMQGATISGYDAIFTPTGPSFGFENVTYTGGRHGRLYNGRIGTSNVGIAVHELSHFIWVLSWRDGTNNPPALRDEYLDHNADTGDSCVMENSGGTPNRYCYTDNHVDQTSIQPRSCWEQILLDYPNFTYAGTNTASTPVPITTVEFHDTP
jgi:hypothetical protein